MTEESREDEAQPRLVCAPCWICLEEGPDEAGEPLVRDCACRGETSAGYHLSCIIKYSIVQIDENLKSENALASRPSRPSSQSRPTRLRDTLADAKFTNKLCTCPNCKTTYDPSIALPVLEAAEKRTSHLSDFHCLRYEILLGVVSVRLGADVTREVYEKTKSRLQELLDALEDSPTDLVLAKYGQLCVAEDLILMELAVIRMRIGRLLSAINKKLGLHSDAMRNLREALDTLGAAETKIELEFSEQKAIIFHEIYKLNRSLGSKTTAADVAAIREKVEYSTANSLHECSWNYRVDLADALMAVDPPEFIEAIKLMQEVVTEVNRTLGPVHSMTFRCKTVLESFKERFRESLEVMRVENESRETMDITKRPKQQEKRDCVQAQQRIAKD